MTDLFEHYETLPKEVADIYWKYSEIAASEGLDYNTCNKYLNEMNAVGYTFEYGLDGEPMNLTKINRVISETN